MNRESTSRDDGCWVGQERKRSSLVPQEVDDVCISRPTGVDLEDPTQGTPVSSDPTGISERSSPERKGFGGTGLGRGVFVGVGSVCTSIRSVEGPPWDLTISSKDHESNNSYSFT